MNHGLTATEIAETIKLPASLEGAWHARGYYGHVRHKCEAIYQKYLGWYERLGCGKSSRRANHF